MAGIISSAMTPDYTAQAQNLYQDTLGRAGDQEGIDYWAGQLASGKSIGDVANSFKDSAKAVYSDVMNNPNSINANNPLIQGDLTNMGRVNAAAEAENTANGLTEYGTPTGPLSASRQQFDAGLGLKSNIYDNLYGSGHTNTPSASPSATPSTSAGAQAYNPAQLGNPNQWHVTPDQTVEGRIDHIIDKDSPIIQAARTRANQASNARGLLNSSMATQAGEAAAYDAALPIASADAQTAAKAAGYNTDESNQFAVQNMNAQNVLAGQKLSADTQRYTANLDAQTRTALANLDSATKTQLTQIDDQNKQLLQSNTSAANMFSNYMNSIANITSSTMDQAAKDTATQNAIANLNQGLQVIQQISGVDISKYFLPSLYTPTAAPAQPSATENTQNQDNAIADWR
jgi:hypothetical protein